jgi:hypothetical protein
MFPVLSFWAILLFILNSSSTLWGFLIAYFGINYETGQKLSCPFDNYHGSPLSLEYFCKSILYSIITSIC